MKWKAPSGQTWVESARGTGDVVYVIPEYLYDDSTGEGSRSGGMRVQTSELERWGWIALTKSTPSDS